MALCWNCKGFHFNLKLISCSGVEEGERYSVRNKRPLLSPSCAPGISSRSSGVCGGGKLCADWKREGDVLATKKKFSSLGSFSRPLWVYWFEMCLRQWHHLIKNSIVGNERGKHVKKVGDLTKWWPLRCLNSFLFFPLSSSPPCSFLLFPLPALFLYLSCFLYFISDIITSYILRNMEWPEEKE